VRAPQAQARASGSSHGDRRRPRRSPAAAAAVSRRNDARSVRAAAALAADPGAEVKAEEWGSLPQAIAVLGSQWGDEGKGKLVDVLAQEYEVVARCQGGANAGHTIYDADGKKYALHLVPSGILNREAKCVVGNGVVVHLPGFFEEVDALEAAGVETRGRLLISDRAHLLFDLHKEVDGLLEAQLQGKKIGTTKRGIGPAYASKATRNGMRVGDLRKPEKFAEGLRRLHAEAKTRFGDGFTLDAEAEVERYKALAERAMPYITDTVEYINTAYSSGKRILIEGANATMLDLDFGTYPYVTSSNPSIGGISAGLGLAPAKFGGVIGVAKAYTTRVGAGPYPTELFGDQAEKLRAAGFEYGTTTGRPRRCGWLDIVALEYATRINGFTAINLTKLDVLSDQPELLIGTKYIGPDGEPLSSFPSDLDLLEEVTVEYETVPGWMEDISGARLWEDLPPNAQLYVERVEELLGVPCKYIGVGPGRDALVIKP